jgi:phage baseplate assembly protein gpV
MLYDAIARIARHEEAARSWAGMGVVTEVHTSVLAGDDHAVTLRLRDSGVVVPRVPIAVGALGFVATPAVGDLVIVVFADGDPHAGVVVGRLHHRDLAPPGHAAGQLVLALPPGDASPAVEALADPATPEVTLRVGDTTVEVTGRTATITIGEATLEVDGNKPPRITISSGEATLTLSGNGDVTLEASKDLTLKAAANLVLEGQARVTVSGGIVEVN